MLLLAQGADFSLRDYADGDADERGGKSVKRTVLFASTLPFVYLA